MMKFLFMDILVKPNTRFIFDLDDTLYPEIEYLFSGYKHIARHLSDKLKFDISEEMLALYYLKENVFEKVVEKYNQTMPELSVQLLLDLYRNHIPQLKLGQEVAEFLSAVKIKKIPTGLITDGRSITQRNKLMALGLADYFDDIIISAEFGSEKPHINNFNFFEKKYPHTDFWYFADNTTKDFIVPAKLAWNIICVLNAGNNIHSQDISHHSLEKASFIKSFNEITLT